MRIARMRALPPPSPHAIPPSRLLVPAAPALVAGHGTAVLLGADGEFFSLPAAEALRRLRDLPPPFVVHAPATFRRLGSRPLPALDLLELFAFALPARTVAPSPRGIALSLELDPPTAGLEAAAALLPHLATHLLACLGAARSLPSSRHAASLAGLMDKAGWVWAPFVAAALGEPAANSSAESLRVWRRLPEWDEIAPRPPPASHPIVEAEARARLAALLGPSAEARPGQADYAAAVSAAFAPRPREGAPHFVLAEAGTGTGKTLGYIAPASLWAERNQATVWISTFTRHLQRQVEAELARLDPEPAARRRRTVVRKGRENYLCLLNLAETAEAALLTGGPALIPLGLIARWAEATADGDIQGGDLPGWFAELFGPGTIASLADRRGECIHAACPHWRRCFVEHGIRRARAADLVIANHALVMTQAAWGGLDEPGVPLRYIFDEGHHLFQAADAAFAVELSGSTMAELRRWLRGAEGSRSRARGLAYRAGELVADQPALLKHLDAALAAAGALPAPGWAERLAAAAEPALLAFGANAAEAFLRTAREQVLARTADDAETVEADLYPVAADLAAASARLTTALAALARPLSALARGLAERLDAEAASLEETLRLRIEATCRTLARRALAPLAAWREMLSLLAIPPPAPDARPEHVTFLRLERRRTTVTDVAMLRHWLDPTEPFAATLARPAHGILVTSATLRDAGASDVEAAWAAAEARSGAQHLAAPAIRAAVQSPFDYAVQTRAFIVTDVAIGDIAALAAAYRVLFLAAGGGALGLFTAIKRLRAVHARIAPALDAAGIPLYAQHVDAMDNATLLDLFRTEEESCLLGTDAMRDGVDVPGRALRLVVFEKVPWARPDILHRERRRHLSGGDPHGYDDRLARLRLRQAFGRLIRTASDRGVFALLDRRTPSRLLSAFPAGVTVRRVGLAEAAAELHGFVGQSA